MVGDFMVCVDRIIASAASLEPGNAACAGEDGGAATEGCSGTKKVGPRNKKAKKGRGAVECRICQEEGEEGDMETPCACNGTLKFAHRKCIQKWCNKKGNITCEICNQVFSPHYSVPLSRPSSDVLAIDIRQSWMTRIDLQDPHLLGITAAEQELLSAEYEDYAVANSSGVACCRTVALILMLLLLVRHILYAVREVGMAQDISVLFNVSLQLAGFFLPCYVIARSCYFIQCRRRHLVCKGKEDCHSSLYFQRNLQLPLPNHQIRKQ